ncbi:hypothetical protein [Hymenobacter ruricola]|uniref:Uncharacterized protein n=1 Tax=Hymenobacter ruricola TaxID=2791023 RepID=A0ABS0I292_9BACT|nr:hypothetical protein [Hymenobacter ruricola]MBF9221071.1 hypothetical protein [Hymenobacter ruricola]
MQTPPPPPAPDNKNPVTWPLVINLGLLLLVAVMGGVNLLPGAVGVLVLINGVAGLINLLAGNRLHYALAFFLSALLLLLIGAGICGILLSNMGPMN